MANADNVNTNNGLQNFLLALMALFVLKSIFENDSSTIVSNQGKSYLSDEKKMQSINGKIKQAENAKQHSEIVI